MDTLPEMVELSGTELDAVTGRAEPLHLMARQIGW